MDRVCQLMRRRKKLLERRALGEDVEEQLVTFENEIEELMPLPEAEERFTKRRDKYDEHRLQIRMLKKELWLVDQILEDIGNLPPAHELVPKEEPVRGKEPARTEQILERNEEKRRD